MESFIDEKGLVILNDGSGTRLGPDGSTSAIDLTFTTPRVAAKCEWSVGYDSSFGSDHFPITTVISTHPQPRQVSGQQRWNFKRANWEMFSSVCQETITDDIKSDDVEIFYKRFKEALISAAEWCITTSGASPGKPGAPWWNDECGEVVQARKQALNKARRSRLPDDYIDAKKKCSAVIKKTKKEYWRTYCAGVSEKTTSKEVWERVNLISGRASKSRISGLFVNDQGQPTTDAHERANLLAD